MSTKNKVICAICHQELPLKQSVRACLKQEGGRWSYYHMSCFSRSEDERIKEELGKRDGEGDELDKED